MRTVRRLFYVDIVSAVAFVALGFLGLFFFIDFVDELSSVGQRGYTVLHGLAHAALEAPGRLYELMPIAVLIGTIFALARLAQTSQYTILRTGGLGPGRALGLLTAIALLFGALTFACGDWLAPVTDRLARELRAPFEGGLKLEKTGAWIRERAVTPEGPRSYSINVRSAEGGSALSDVRILEFDAENRLVARTFAKRARVRADGLWQLRDVTVTRWSDAASAPRVDERRVESLEWRTTLSPGVVAAAVLPVTTMSTVALWRYIDHLAGNEQTTQSQKIQFWKRALYPFACVVMVALALPFAYLGARSGGTSFKVFLGVMIGVSFVLLNNVFRHLGVLENWTPWLVAAAPGALYLTASLAAFAWLVRYR